MDQIKTYVLYSLILALPLHANTIGDITELKGNGRIVRDEPFAAVLDFDINSYDNVQTANGRIGITFLDDSQVRLTEHSKLIIDEYIFNPNPDKSKMSLTFASGTIRFVSGSVNKLNKKNVTLSTPTADIAILGTDFTVTVNELGESLIILLPDANGLSSGEIIVSTAAGQVTLNKPYQATTASMYEQPPTEPIELDIDLQFIDNMLIINPPKEKVVVEERQVARRDDYLDFTDLDIDFLNEDLLALEEDFDYSELDIDYLSVEFLEDLLDVIDDLDIKEEDELNQFVSAVPITGTSLGQDLETQIVTILQGDEIKIIRNVNQYVTLELNADQGYSVLIIQDGVSKSITINNSSSSTIRISQGSG
tara:strand:- start:869 stop:1963 length:1095 start_codon:yes stop_codon:yes gene_type:complete